MAGWAPSQLIEFGEIWKQTHQVVAGGGHSRTKGSYFGTAPEVKSRTFTVIGIGNYVSIWHIVDGARSGANFGATSAFAGGMGPSKLPKSSSYMFWGQSWVSDLVRTQFVINQSGQVGLCIVQFMGLGAVSSGVARSSSRIAAIGKSTSGNRHRWCALAGSLWVFSGCRVLS